jgi:four helix bundle protein
MVAMAGVKSFVDLKCWQNARELSKQIYYLSREKPFAADRRLVEQVNDSSESVFANIAEGFGRGTQGEFITFLSYSIGSLDETRAHLCAAFDRGYLNRETFEALWRQSTEVRQMTVGLISSMVQAGGGVKYLRKVPSWTDQVWEVYERVTGKKRPELYQRETQYHRVPRQSR